jgi:hypothetical protein
VAPGVTVRIRVLFPSGGRGGTPVRIIEGELEGDGLPLGVRLDGTAIPHLTVATGTRKPH